MDKEKLMSKTEAVDITHEFMEYKLSRNEQIEENTGIRKYERQRKK